LHENGGKTWPSQVLAMMLSHPARKQHDLFDQVSIGEKAETPGLFSIEPFTD